MPDEIESNRLADRVNHARDVQSGLAGRAVGTDPSCSAENRVEVDGADILIRNDRPTDATTVRALYATGRVAGDAATTEVPDDLKQLEDAYGDAQDTPFWVAVDRGELVGMVGLLKESRHVGRLRRPPPAPRFRETTLPGQLVRIALQYGANTAYSKSFSIPRLKNRKTWPSSVRAVTASRGVVGEKGGSRSSSTWTFTRKRRARRKLAQRDLPALLREFGAENRTSRRALGGSRVRLNNDSFARVRPRQNVRIIPHETMNRTVQHENQRH